MSISFGRFLAFGAGVVAAAALATGCAHEVESPKVTAAGVSPDLVCNAQLTTPVVITGSGFAPLPTKTLEDTSILILPSVGLVKQQDLAGAAATGFKLGIPGDPAGANADHLSWQSEGQMTLSVDEPLALEPGLYDVSVTNPDGKQKAVIALGLAVVPPPVITELIPPALCDAQSDQTLVIEGEYFLNVGGTLPVVHITAADGTVQDFPVVSLTGCTPIPGREPPAELCTTATVTIPEDSLAPGVYDVVLQNPAPAQCSSTEAVQLTVNPPPTVDAVVPANICSGGSTVVISGEGFLPGATVSLECPGGVSVDATNVTVDGPTQLTATFGPGIQVGETCDVVVTNADGCFDEPPHQTVQGVDGPILFYVDPPVVYNGINTQITLYVTAIVGTATVTLYPDGQTTGGTTLTSQLVTGTTNRLQATVPSGQAPGTYDVAVSDGTGCSAVLDDGLIVTDQLTLNLTAISPAYGLFGEFQAVQITGQGFTSTPRGFLNPVAGGVAVQFEGMTWVDGGRLNAVVPNNAPAGDYDVIVVNPDGAVGRLAAAYHVTTSAPPVVTDVSPTSIVSQAGQAITVTGTGLDQGTLAVDCRTPGGADVADATIGGATCGPTSCTATLDASAVPAGSICVITVTTANGVFDFSAIGVAGPSLNLANPTAASSLNQARRALGSAAVRANGVSRFVYAIGGDAGAAQAASPFASVEFASVDLYGSMGPWTTLGQSLNAARSFHAIGAVGRYIYAFGGSDGGAALATAERAMVLSPAEIPHIADVDLCLSGGAQPCFGVTGIQDGLDAGQYSYRVAAVIDTADTVNLGGETLASDPIILRLPDINGRTVSVKLTWADPEDALGAPLTGIVGWRVYRTPADGVPGQDEVLLGTLTAAAPREFVDDGSATLGTERPLPPGSTSAWQALPAMGTPRRGLASAVAQDPADATRWHVYAFSGEGLSSYEYLSVTVQPNGRQAPPTAWTAGSANASINRHEFGAWVVTSKSNALVTGTDSLIYLGGGRSTAGGRTGAVDAAWVQPGGDLGAWDATPGDFSSNLSGYATFVVGTKLLVFGGAALPSGNPQADAVGGEMQAPVPSLANWNNEGLSMTSARALLGCSVESAFVFLIGGEATAGGAALASTESLAY